MPSSPYTPHKVAVALRLAMSMAAMLLGFAATKAGQPVLGVALAAVGFWTALDNGSRMVRIHAAERQWRAAGGERLRARSGAESLPRLVFVLLYTIAESDGRAGPREQAVVRQFLLDRFLDPRVAADLMAWNAVALDPTEVGAVCFELRLRLNPAECATLFTWCCLVALIDQRFHAKENALLQSIATRLGIDPGMARRLFHDARQEAMRVGAAAAGGFAGRGPRGPGWRGNGGGDRSRRDDPPPPPRQPTSQSRRREALATLGLDEGATEAEIRRRHRELVKQHHPDAHTHLGPVAQQEATERFRRIQAAYEVLVGRR